MLAVVQVLDQDLVEERLWVRSPPCLSRPADGGRYVVVCRENRCCASGNRCSWCDLCGRVVVFVDTLGNRILQVEQEDENILQAPVCLVSVRTILCRHAGHVISGGSRGRRSVAAAADAEVGTIGGASSVVLVASG